MDTKVMSYSSLVMVNTFDKDRNAVESVSKHPNDVNF